MNKVCSSGVDFVPICLGQVELIMFSQNFCFIEIHCNCIDLFKMRLNVQF